MSAPQHMSGPGAGPDGADLEATAATPQWTQDSGGPDAGGSAGPSAPTRIGAGGGAPRLPKTIGRYRIKGVIGSGGMGAVYLAVQELPKRTVAVKVIRGGLASPAALRRFEYESQVLARMRHPGIAQIYEAGTHDDGTGPVPYFAMEYIPDALTLREFAERRGLGVRERIGLFIKVCEAVQYGHTKAVIHRDLKPANILVDASGWPKIIDYGVARGVDSDLAEATLQTNVGQLVGTPQYMAPEQCSGDPHSVDVRSDIYSLGVVLYELLSGRYPYDLGTTNVYEVAKRICETPPAPIGSVEPRLRGDVETILAKALEKDRDRRYASVAEFAADLQRYLNDEPILARPVGPLGRLAKWVKRNRELATVGTAAALILATVSLVLVARIVAAERQATANLSLAEQNLRAARQNFELVRDMLEFKDADGTTRVRSGMVDVERLLDDAAANLDRNRPEFASTEADFREILGVSYTGLRALSKAREQLARVVEIRRGALPGPDAPDAALADALHNLAAALFWDSDYRQAHAMYESSLAMRKRLHPGDHAETAFSLTHLAACALKLGRLPEARTLYEQALEMRQRLHGTEHPDVAASLNNVAKVWMELEEYRRAETYLRRSYEMIAALTGGRDIAVSHAAHNLAGSQLAQGRHVEAMELYRRALEIRLELLPKDHTQVGASRVGLARCHLGLGELPEAEGEARAALATYRARLRDDHPDLAEALETLGLVLLAAGRPEEAEPHLREAVHIGSNRSARPPNNRASSLLAHGRCLAQLGRAREAEPALLEALRIYSERYTPDDSRPRSAARALVDLYETTGDAEKRERYAALLAAG